MVAGCSEVKTDIVALGNRVGDIQDANDLCQAGDMDECDKTLVLSSACLYWLEDNMTARPWWDALLEQQQGIATDALLETDPNRIRMRAGQLTEMNTGWLRAAEGK